VSFVLSFVNFFGRVYLLWGQAGRRAKGSLQRAATARTADRKTGHNVRRRDLHRSNASMIKQKKISLNWSIDSEEATGSDYEVIVWETLGGTPSSRDSSREVTGWDISGWNGTGKGEEEQKAAPEKKVAAQQCFLRAGNGIAVLDDTSSAEQVEEAAVALREAIVGTLNNHARAKR